MVGSDGKSERPRPVRLPHSVPHSDGLGKARPSVRFSFLPMTTFQKEKANALLAFLEYAHAEQYRGTDDDMPDACNDWIGNLTDKEVTDLVLAVYHEGI